MFRVLWISLSILYTSALIQIFDEHYYWSPIITPKFTALATHRWLFVNRMLMASRPSNSYKWWMHKICKHIKSLISQCMLYYIWILFTRETYGSSCRENKIKTPGDMQLRTHTLQVTFRSSIIVVAAPSSWCIATIKHFTSTNPPPPPSPPKMQQNSSTALPLMHTRYPSYFYCIIRKHIYQ